VGGHARNIGKTDLVAQILRTFPQGDWTAVKITRYGHGICASEGEPCRCSSGVHGVALDEEQDSLAHTDTSRFLAAGARRALWLRTQPEAYGQGVALLREAIASSPRVIVESNSILRFVRPLVYLSVLDPRVADCKDSARQYLERASAVVLRAPLQPDSPFWAAAHLSPNLLRGIRKFLMPLGEPLPGELADMISAHFPGIATAQQFHSGHLSS
jgi:hypothetical protein